MSLGENISRLISRRNRKKMNNAVCNMLSNEMTINLNMFDAIMKDIIVNNLNGTLIVTMERGGTRGRNTYQQGASEAIKVCSASVLERAMRDCFVLYQVRRNRNPWWSVDQ